VAFVHAAYQPMGVSLRNLTEFQSERAGNEFKIKQKTKKNHKNKYTQTKKT